ncbi:MAG TPA: hypothetical protein VGE58_05550 [Daejeonella sp.]
MLSKSTLVALLLFASCQAPGTKQAKKYMDLTGFFEKESARLSQTGVRVEKTVSRNGLSENKDNVLPNWETELSLFTESDINKAAWRDSYKIVQDSTMTTYIALDSKLRTRSIEIRKNQQGNLQGITIVNHTANALYSSAEELIYIPDSIYRIAKKQDVILLGNNNYEISGIFK